MPLQLSPTFATRLAEADRPLAGLWACAGSNVVTEIIAGAGMDWLLIDMEHSPNTLDSVLTQLQVCAAYPVTTMVRVPTLDPVVLKQVLDLGAQNIMVPMVSTPQQAQDAVAAVRYPPLGMRGVGSALARSGRWNRVDGYVHDAHYHVSLTVQLETAEAIEHAEEIASVDGVDALFVGPSDLAASMGLLGQQNHPDVVAAVKRAFGAVKRAGKPAGVNAFDPDAAQDYVAAGADFLLVGADVSILAGQSSALAAQWNCRP